MILYRVLPFFALILCTAVSASARSGETAISTTVSADSLWFGRIEARSAVADTVWVKPSSTGSPLVVLAAQIVARHSDFSVVLTPAPTPITDSAAVVVRYSSRHNVHRDGVLFIRVYDGLSIYSIPVKLAGEAFYSDPTYDFTNYLSGKPLVDALRTYTKAHTALTYNQARDLMFGTIDKRAGDTLECPYSGRKIRAANRTDAQAQNFNTEHTWPQSLGAENEPPKSDMYHLRATDLTINDKRANYPFGYVVKDVQYEQNGSKLGKDANGATVFEVRSRYRGDIARGLFYFAVCYSNPSSFLNQQETVLRQWSEADTIDAEESARNTAIAQHQKRRNPFIDHPEFLERVYSISGSADFPRIPNPVRVDSIITWSLVSDKTEMTVFFGNRGTDTAMVKSVEVQSSTGVGSELITSVDSALAPDGSARVVIARPASATAADSLKVIVKFADGVPQQTAIVRFAGSTDVGEQSVHEEILRAVPNPSSGHTAVVVPGDALCVAPVVRVVTPLGGDVQDVDISVVHENGAQVVRFQPMSSLASGLYFCRIECGNRVFICPLYINR